MLALCILQNLQVWLRCDYPFGTKTTDRKSEKAHGHIILKFSADT